MPESEITLGDIFGTFGWLAAVASGAILAAVLEPAEALAHALPSPEKNDAAGLAVAAASGFCGVTLLFALFVLGALAWRALRDLFDEPFLCDEREDDERAERHADDIMRRG